MACVRKNKGYIGVQHNQGNYHNHLLMHSLHAIVLHCGSSTEGWTQLCFHHAFASCSSHCIFAVRTTQNSTVLFGLGSLGALSAHARAARGVALRRQRNRVRSGRCSSGHQLENKGASKEGPLPLRGPPRGPKKKRCQRSIGIHWPSACNVKQNETVLPRISQAFLLAGRAPVGRGIKKNKNESKKKIRGSRKNKNESKTT